MTAWSRLHSGAAHRKIYFDMESDLNLTLADDINKLVFEKIRRRRTGTRIRNRSIMETRTREKPHSITANIKIVGRPHFPKQVAKQLGKRYFFGFHE